MPRQTLGRILEWLMQCGYARDVLRRGRSDQCSRGSGEAGSLFGRLGRYFLADASDLHTLKCAKNCPILWIISIQTASNIGWGVSAHLCGSQAVRSVAAQIPEMTEGMGNFRI